MDTPREPQDMEEESVTDTESESESAVTLSSTGSESLSENDTEKRWKKQGKKTKKKQSCKQPGPSTLYTPSKKRRAKESSQYLSQNQSELVVTCGDKEGVLYVEKFNDSTVEKCIFSEDQWFKPTEFERFGGKERNKKWKISICCDGISLQKLIENGRLSSIKKRRVQTEQEHSPGSSPLSGRLRRRQCRRQVIFSSSDSDGRDEDGDDDDDDDDDDDNDDDNDNEEDDDNDGDDNDDDDDDDNDDDNNDGDDNDDDDDDDDNDNGADELNQFSLEFSVILDSSSDESISVAERDKLNRGESVNSTEAVSKQITEPVGSTASDRDSPARPVDASEPGVSPVIEEAVQTTDDPTGAAQLSFSASPERQNPVVSEETQETRQLQLYEFLAKQFNTINNTLQSIDLSLKKLVEKQSHDTLSQYIRITPGENSKILALVKQESLNL